MKTKIEIDIKPFDVPDHVHEITNVPGCVSRSHDVNPTIPSMDAPVLRKPIELLLSDIDAVTLEKMCDEFRESIFKKAGKSRPPIEAAAYPAQQ